MRSLAIRDHSRGNLLGLIGILVAFATTSDAGAGALCPSFPVASSFALSGIPNGIALADLDGDHVPDLVTANGLGYDVSVLRGDGDGSFQAAVSIAAGGSPGGIAVADLDRDGIPDLVTANPSSDQVNVLLGNGDSTFQPAVAFAAGDGPNSIAVADFNGDGVPDLVAGSQDYPLVPHAVSILLGNGDGSFQAAVSFALIRAPYSVAVADFNSDSAIDLVTVNSRGAEVLLGNGDGSFQAAVLVRSGRFLQPTSLAVADLNGDHIADLVFTGSDSYPPSHEDVDVLLGNGDGSFQAPVGFPAGVYGSSVAAADLDGDGASDLVVVNEYGDGVSVLLGNGDASLQEPVYFSTGKRSRPEIVAIADLDGDGTPDVVTGNTGSFTDGKVSVLLGKGDGSFKATPSYPLREGPYSVAVGDLDGDSVPDLVTAAGYYGFNPGELNVLLGRGNGSYRAAVRVADFGLFSVAVGDLDGDDIPDLVTGRQDFDVPTPPVIDVLLGNGDATFQEANAFAIEAFPRSVAIADLDGDSHPDIVAVGVGVSVLLGNGDGSFEAAVSFPTGTRPVSVAVSDLDGDGIPDLVTANNTSSDLSVLLGSGDGSFQAAVSFAAGTNPTSVAAADFDGDGVPDLAVSNYTSNDVSVLLGNGDGSFESPVSNAVGFGPNSVAVGDLNGDSIPDIVSADSASSFSGVSVLLGNGDGSFQPAVAFESGEKPAGVAVADLNGDHISDIALANLSSGDVTVLINQCEPPAVAVDLDIKPGSDPNPINPSVTGVFPVAILGSDSFDVYDVSGATLRFGPNEAPLAHWRGPHYEDVNGDGVTDLLAHFRVEDTGIAFGNRMACIEGETLDGQRFEGCDSIRTVPDMDGDSLLDLEEAAIGTHPLRFDSDGDGYGDGTEVLLMGTDPLDPLDPKPVADRERRGAHKRRR